MQLCFQNNFIFLAEVEAYTKISLISDFLEGSFHPNFEAIEFINVP